MLLLLVLLVLLITGWIGYVSYLTAREDRACGVGISAVKGSISAGDDSELQRVLDSYSARNGGVGLQATVIFLDGTTWSGTSGYASRERSCPLTLDHHLYIGSITKLYTAMLVMDQVEGGKISLDDTLDQWADLPYADAVTVKMLLNHTSGIPSHTEDLSFLVRLFGLARKQWETDELVRVISSKPLKFEPGSRHEYSNSNYLLLGVILEKVTGKPYESLVQEVVDELGLEDTFFFTYPDDAIIANGYDETIFRLGTRNLTGFRRSLETGGFSAGGMLSTSEDVALFVHSSFIGQIVGDSILAQMTTFVEAPDQDVPLQAGYGLGIRNLVIGGENLVGHTGTIPGYSGIALHNPEKRYTVVVLSNLSVIEQTELFAEVQSIVLGKHMHTVDE